jgi:CRP-like cAMP-binding protein
MQFVEKVEFLRKVSLFSGLSNEGIEAIAESVKEFAPAPGEEIFHRGDDAHSVCMVVTGQVEIWSDTQKLGEVGPYGLFGELAFLDNKPRSATAIAKTGVVLLALEKPEFHQLLEDLPELARAVIAQLMAYLRKSELFRV